MSRHATRRPDQGIRSAPPAPEARTDPAVNTADQPAYMDRGWIVVQWLWPLCFVLLPLWELGMFLFRKLMN